MGDSPILVVEDDEDTRESLADLLRYALDVEVDTAPDGVAARQLLEARSYSVVLSDQRMPRLAGNQLLQWVREHRPDTHRALMSAYPDGAALGQTADSHAFLEKPLDLDVLLTTLADLLAQPVKAQV